MNIRFKFNSSVRSMAAAVITCGAMILTGCASHPATTTSPAAAKPASLPWPLVIHDPAKHQSGAQLWAENCMRCHELRSPSQYTPGQWSIIIQYMRLKAGLTGEQAKKIEAFLKASSEGG